MEDVLAETAITYPETYVQSMTGSQIKDILEDVCDNLFNADPYYQQGGDMVRVGGLAYTCTPAEASGRGFPISSSITAGRSKPARPTRWRDGLPSTNSRECRCGMCLQNICVPGKHRSGAAPASP